MNRKKRTPRDPKHTVASSRKHERASRNLPGDSSIVKETPSSQHQFFLPSRSSHLSFLSQMGEACYQKIIWQRTAGSSTPRSHQCPLTIVICTGTHPSSKLLRVSKHSSTEVAMPTTITSHPLTSQLHRKEPSTRRSLHSQPSSSSQHDFL
jgi:hypothetical protein